VVRGVLEVIRRLDMDGCEVKSVKAQKEGNVVDLNTTNRVKNKSIRRAQVLTDKRRKNKVRNQKLCMCQHAYWYRTQIVLGLLRTYMVLAITTVTVVELYFVGSMKQS
jgi:hypothetical protein